MTNEEHNNWALKIYNENDDFFERIEENPKYLQITNISELFISKIHYAFNLLNEPTPKSEIVRESNNVDKELNKNNPEEKDVSIYESPLSEELSIIAVSTWFKGLAYAVDNWENIEDLLLYFGLDNPSAFIFSVKNIANISDVDERLEKEASLLSDLLSVNKSDLAFDFLIYVLFASYRNTIITKCKKTSQKSVLEFLKFCKYLGERYPSLYKKRISKILFTLKKVSKDINKIVDLIDEYDMNYFVNKFISYNSLDEIINDDEDIDFSDKNIACMVDVMFALYHFFYICPQNIIKIAFFLMSGRMSPQLQEAMFKSFSATDYNTLIQYEYEWWRRNTGQTLDIPYQFSAEPFDKNNTTIVDYDLDDEKYNTDIFINQPKLIVYKDPTTQVVEENNSIVTRKQIIHDLNPYFKIFMNRPGQTRGSFFIAHYLDDIIAFSEAIKDSYNAYGFAYILFNSKYFNWDNAKFDDNFVNNIISIFGIKIEEDKTYTESKAKDSAKKILNKTELQGILNEDALKSFDL